MEFVNIPRPNDPSSVVQGILLLKSLSQFIKCTPLCSTVEIYLSYDMPLFCSYDVASLGSIKLCLSPLLSQNFVS
jgi:proliferating cell nuclear antigen